MSGRAVMRERLGTNSDRRLYERGSVVDAAKGEILTPM